MNKVVVLDKITSTMFDDNPNAKNIITGQKLGGERFELVVADSGSLITEEGGSVNMSDYFVMPFSGNKINDFVPMTDYAKSQSKDFLKYLVPSELYVNTYFEVENYETQYWQAYESIFNAFVAKLGGGSSKKICYSKEEIETSTKEQGNNISAEGRYGTIGVKGGYSSSDKSENINTNTHTKESTATSFQPKCSVQDMEKWIEEKKINVKGLPPKLRLLIEEFLSRGCLQYEYEEKEEITTTISSTQEMMENIHAELSAIPVVIKAKVEYPLQQAMKQSKKIKNYFRVSFKHDGV